MPRQCVMILAASVNGCEDVCKDRKCGVCVCVDAPVVLKPSVSL